MRPPAGQGGNALRGLRTCKALRTVGEVITLQTNRAQACKYIRQTWAARHLLARRFPSVNNWLAFYQ